MQFTFSKGVADVPVGKYMAQFVGIKLLEDRGAKDKDGNPLPPGMAWEFQITEGEHAGKRCDRVTGRQPTPKSGCGKMLAAITDSILQDGQTYDVEQLRGKVYRITVEEKASGMGTRVSDNPAPVRQYSGPTGYTAPTPPPPPGARPAPPPAGEPADDSRWSVWDGHNNSYLTMTGQEVRAYFAAQKCSPEAVQLCPEGSQDVKPASQYGFTNIPF